MTEQEYIDASNLSKLRVAQTAVRNCLFTGEQAANEALHIAVLERIEILIEDVEPRVRKALCI